MVKACHGTMWEEQWAAMKSHITAMRTPDSWRVKEAGPGGGQLVVCCEPPMAADLGTERYRQGRGASLGSGRELARWSWDFLTSGCSHLFEGTLDSPLQVLSFSLLCDLMVSLRWGHGHAM